MIKDLIKTDWKDSLIVGLWTAPRLRDVTEQRSSSGFATVLVALSALLAMSLPLTCLASRLRRRAIQGSVGFAEIADESSEL